jgi:hypothetical protein
MKLTPVAAALIAAVMSLDAIGQTVTPPKPSPPPAPIPPEVTPVRPSAPAPSALPRQMGMRVGTISGQVVSATDGRPVARAAVRLYGRGVTQTRLTDEKGRVIFSDVPPGEFTINATKSGYFDGSYGKRRAGGTGMPVALPAGQSISDLKIELFRPGVISGYVFDEGNEPVIGARVVAMRRQFTGGQWRFTPIGDQITDDEGSYRIFGLMPGDYVVGVPSVQVTAPIAWFESIANTGTNAGTGGFSLFYYTFFYAPLAAESPDPGFRSVNRLAPDSDDRHVMLAPPAMPPPATGRREFAYSTRYYPAAEAIATALPVSIASGEDHRGVNFALRPVPTARVEGMVVGPNGAVGGQILRLIPVDSDDFGPGTETAATISDPNGTFAFLRVPPGRYRIEAQNDLAPTAATLAADANSVAGRAAAAAGNAATTGVPSLVDTPGSQPMLWGRAEVGVDDADVDDVIVLMQPSLTVSATTFFESGGTPRPAPEQLGRVQVSLAAASGAASRPALARLDGAGRFIIRNLAPGAYYVRVDNAPPGWYLKSAIAAGRDVSDAPLELPPGADETAIAITFTDRATEIAGTVRDVRGIAAGATIIIMPATAQGVGFNPTRMREVRAASTGAFTISGLPPGEYLVVAIDDAAAEGWQDPARLAALRSQATKLTLRDAEKRSLELRVNLRR